jgi:hypothetical protein
MEFFILCAILTIVIAVIDDRLWWDLGFLLSALFFVIIPVKASILWLLGNSEVKYFLLLPIIYILSYDATHLSNADKKNRNRDINYPDRIKL